MLIEITVLFCYVEKLRYSGKVQMGSGRGSRERRCIYVQLIHIVQQKHNIVKKQLSSNLKKIEMHPRISSGKNLDF